MLVLAESVAERQEENKEEKKTQSNLYAMHAKHVITIPRKNSTINYWGGLGAMTSSR